MSTEELAYAGVEKIKELNNRVKIPKFRDLGIEESEFRAIAECSANNPLSDDNAKEITADEYLELIYKAYEAE